MPRVIVLLVVMCASFHAGAATLREIMASRYMQNQFCIERAVGQRWHERYDVLLVLNKWGVSEPTISALASAPVAVRSADATCRKANGIQDEPRPR